MQDGSSQFHTLEPADSRLRTACETLSKAELRKSGIQNEISIVLDAMYGGMNRSESGERINRGLPTTVGLSANQIGIMKRISAVDLSIGRPGYVDVSILINPKILWRSASTIEHLEGCVNFPDVWGKVRRSKVVRLEALDRSGHEMSIELTGWAAALAQHEVDHLNGVLFIDHLANPAEALHVPLREFAVFRASKDSWSRTIDVSGLVRPVPAW